MSTPEPAPFCAGFKPCGNCHRYDPPRGDTVTEICAAATVLHMNASLPKLYIPWPRCGHCGEDVMIDDGAAWCEGCLIQWDSIDEDTPAKPDETLDGTEVPCGIAVGRTDPPHDDKRGNHYEPQPPEPCILPSGHTGAHLNPYRVLVTPSPEGGDR